jgi:hypothetical protein
VNYQLIVFSGTPKAGSTWLGGLFSGIAIEMGMNFFYGQYAIPKNHEIIMKNRFDLVISQSSDYDRLQELNLPYKCIHIIRDPRDILVSSYYSYKKTHNVDRWPELKNLRKKLHSVSFDDGMLETMKFNCYFYKTLQNWNYNDRNILELKYEDMIQSPEYFLIEIFHFLGLTNDNLKYSVVSNINSIYNRIIFRKRFIYNSIRIEQKSIPINRIKAINQKLSFDKLSKGRRRGSENSHSHYRKGIIGDWKSQFSEVVKSTFKNEYGDLLIQLGYEKNYTW